jgi:uncharacterized protein (PEP-CTERM system associated)
VRGEPLFAIHRLSGMCRRCMAGFPLALIGLQASAWAQETDSSLRARSRDTQGWQIRPSLSVSESFSDNVALTSPAFARNEWTTSVRPSILVSGNSARLRLNAVYTPELLTRIVENTTGISHFLNAGGQAELLAYTVFVDFKGNVSQQNISLLGPQADSNINATANRTSVRTFSVSPFLRYEFGADATGELRLTRDANYIGGGSGISGNTGAVSSSTSNRIDTTLTSGPAYRLLTWNLALSKSNVDYRETNQRIDAERVSAAVGRLVGQDFRLNANIGYEDSGYPDSFGQKLKGAFWSIGPEWAPSPRTRMSATYGRQYFGPSRAFHFDHRTRLTVWGLDYSESVTTTRYNQTVQVPSPLAVQTDALLRNDPQFQDPIVRQAEVQNRIAATPQANLTEPLNFLTNALFLEKRLQGTLGNQGLTNSFLGSLFMSNRNALSSGAGVGTDFGATQSVKQSGVSLSWNARLTETRVSILNFAALRSSFGRLDRTDRTVVLRWSLTEQFTPRVTGSVILGRRKNDSNEPASIYQENSVSVTLGLRH